MLIGRPGVSFLGRLFRRLAVASPSILGLVLLVAACASPTAQPESTPMTAEAQGRQRRSVQVSGPGTSVARLGAALSLSGSAAGAGAPQRNGMLLAQDEINASHMLDRVRLEVLVEDDESDREQAAAVFRKFIENSHVVGILGPTLSDNALAVDPIAQQAGIPVLAVSNSAGGLTEIGDFVFRDCLSESQLSPQTVKMVKSRLKVRTAALLYNDTDANRTGAHGFKSALLRAHVTISAEEVFSTGATNFSDQLAQIASRNPDAVFVTAPGHDAAAILIQARRFGLSSVPIVGSNAFNAMGVLRNAGDAAEGLVVGSGWSAANPSPRNQQFIESYRARYGSEPDQFAAQAYTGVYLMAAALKDAHTSSDSRALRDALARLDKLDTPLGAFSFNEARDADYAPTVQIVRNGKFELF
jgi:branched-chain amino acid transport system substrate-binding protein